MGGGGFFYGSGDDPESLIERLFDLAHFWRLPPSTILELPLDDAFEYEKQARRIAVIRSPEV